MNQRIIINIIWLKEDSYEWQNMLAEKCCLFLALFATVRTEDSAYSLLSVLLDTFFSSSAYSVSPAPGPALSSSHDSIFIKRIDGKIFNCHT